MLNERQRLWIDALRSGRFKQTKRVLGKKIGGETYNCCLGVMCEVARENGVQVPVKVDEAGGIRYGELQSSQTSSIPRMVADFFGVRPDIRCLHPLAQMNDGGRTFEEIAQYVEALPEVFFREEA